MMELLGVRKGAWTEEEDLLLRKCIETQGEGNWRLVPQKAGLNRCRKSCRLRWLNYLRPSIKRGGFTDDEVDLIIRLHKLLGNRWSLIAPRLAGRTPTAIKNFWNVQLKKKFVTQERESSKKVEVIRPLPRTYIKRPIPSQVTTSGGPSYQDERSMLKPPSTVNEHTIWCNDLLVDRKEENVIGEVLPMSSLGESMEGMGEELEWEKLLLDLELGLLSND